MTRILLAMVLAFGLAGPVMAQSDEIQGVIGAQLEAFLADDFATAFTYASPTIRQIFRTPENFGSMVRQGYPMVWRPAEVDYLGLEERDGRVLQRVEIADGNGTLHVLEYEMVETAEGWQINGVRILPAPEIGV
ncbi:DUF4864 domain-containing protein [Pseudoruegeria sp. HB172150]|uniref:DUF4864 domain-containing protein n=1 Tax=Pseudoruegeria sp. HB172150 TaxID=2721164 RepID=UPI001555FD1A|nr:DUF4864 domain-containing protein [Pseudoruegeria sp. HB172150]